MLQLPARTSASWCFVVFVAVLVQLSAAGEDGIQFYGHDIKLRPAFMSRDGQHSFVDANVTLTRGILKAFRFFVHNLADDTVLSNVTAQIWRPIMREDAAFRLVWEKEISFEFRNNEFVATLDPSEEFQIENMDKIGFECSQNTCPITMDIDPTGKTFIRKAQKNVLGKVFYDFKGPIATVFSIGADILPSIIATTSNPGLNGISMTEDELLSPNGDQSPSSDNWNRETSGMSEQELEVSNSAENIDSSEDDEDTFEEPSYTPEQRDEMLGRSVYLGHNLTLEDEFWAKAGRKTFIDTAVKLQNGILKAISLYVHDAPLKVEDIELYLELWSRYAPETSNFKLEWQKKVKLTHGTNRLYEFILNPRDRVAVTDKHRLGFTNLNHDCPITFKYGEEGRTLFKSVKRYEGPSFVDHVYHFSEIHEPILFSMGAHVTPVQNPQQDREDNEIDVPRVIRIGHPLTRRQHLLPNSPEPRVFVDHNVRLTPGYLTKFIAFIGQLPAHDLRAPLRLQIWTYNGTAGEGTDIHPVYKLKWQQIFRLSNLTVTTRGKRQEEFVLTDRLLVDSNDKIGFVSEGRTVHIPYDFNNPLGQAPSRDLVYIMALNKTERGEILYPEVRDEVYHFDAHPNPITWSIEVEIQPTGDIVPER